MKRFWLHGADNIEHHRQMTRCGFYDVHEHGFPVLEVELSGIKWN
jgi:hypothetical protein